MDSKARKSSSDPSPVPRRRSHDVRVLMGSSPSPAEVSGASNPSDRPPTASQPSQSAASAAEAREAKTRALQERLQSGTYHAPAEQIADKILHDLLCAKLP
jgi:anti-sigma28 factor (negative regulator of flagellin synthesis)